MFDFDNVSFFPEQASTIAPQTDMFVIGITILSAVLSLMVTIAIIYFVVVYNRGNGDVDRSNAPDENTALELTWSIIPLILCLSIFVWSADIYFKMVTPPPNTLNISVIGKQWMWKAQHPDGQREVNTLHVPINQPVKITMTSQDVIHSFYIPAFRVKQDAVPGRFTTLWFEANKVGEYTLYCAEYCGTEHSLMIGKVHVMEPADYEAWLRQGQFTVSTGATGGGDTAQAVTGETLFESKACYTCHKLNEGEVGIGPNFGVRRPGSDVELDNGEIAVYDEEYIRESILNPSAKLVAGYGAVMPTYEGQVTDEELLMLTDYILSLSE